VVVDRDGSYLDDPYLCIWESDDVLNGIPPRLFATPAEAHAGLVWSQGLADEREERCEEALRRLDRDE
jgi:hypothetical protein